MIRNIAFVVGAIALSPVAFAAEPVAVDSFVKPFLKTYCIDCHGADTQESGVALHELDGVTAENAELWKSVWEQVALKEMPPQDGSELPELMQRHKLSSWITDQLKHALRDKGGFETHLVPAKGNHVDHDLLFGDLSKIEATDEFEPASTPARLWRLHPQEHLARLSALINDEPDFDPAKPGLRTRGDFVSPNEEGEVKVYYGLDRVIGWVGGTAAYAASITGFPPMLSLDDHHGLRSYPILQSVNGSEATQIARNAETILRFMAFGPEAKPYQFAKRTADIDQKYKHGDLRGLAESLFYGLETKRPLTPIYDLLNEPGMSDERLRTAVDFLFEQLTCRPPTLSESNEYVAIVEQAVADLGKEDGVVLGLTSIFLDRDALFRPELASSGQPDAYGRAMLQDWELALAINAAFSYLGPDETLTASLAEGTLKTRDDVRREVKRILADPSIRKPRVLQFFREYFDYDRAGKVCKDSAALRAAGGNPRDLNHYRIMFTMTAQTDRLIELILEEDRDVLKELLTTDRIVIDRGKDLHYLGEFVSSQPPPKPKDDEKKKRRGPQRTVTVSPLDPPKGKTVHVRVARVVKGVKPARTITTLPADQRMGILTHPAWLVSHSDAMDNHAILRGRWVRERLLGDAVPDVPITVDAMLPDEPKETLRHRMRVTREAECWRCHKKMDPLGLPFEMFNHVGLYRKIEHDKPVDTSGEIIASGDSNLDGPVDDAIDMIQRLAESERVEQVFVRHAFRFWMGRNETLNDARVLQEAHEAYKSNGGSMNALLTSLLTSDAFLYRKVER